MGHVPVGTCTHCNRGRMRVTRTVSLAILLVTSAGCAIHQNAEPTAFPEGVLVGRHSAGTVALANAQTVTEPANIGSLGMYGTMYGNLSQWTDAAIELLTKKLKDSGMTVSTASSRKLSLAVTDARIGYTGGGFAWAGAVSLSVEGEDGVE